MKRIAIPLLLAVGLILSACGPTPTPAPTPDLAPVQTQAVEDAYAELTAGAPTATSPAPAATPDPNLPVAVVPAPAEGQPSGLVLYNTAIMSGPGEAYVFYAGLLGGAAVEVLGISEDSLWWVISVPPAPNGQGWVSAAFLATTGAESVPIVTTPPVPPTTEMVPPGPDDPQASALANVYVRNGPGSNYPAYGIAPSGTSGRVIGVSEDRAWWVVRVDPTKIGAGYGWVMAQYTTATNTEDVPVIANPPTMEAVTPAPPPAGVPVAMAIEFVNVRTGPGTNYPVLGVAAPGAAAEVSGKSADGAWWQVKVATTTISSGLAWVSAGYVVTQNTESVPVVEGPPAPPPVEATPLPPPATASCTLVSQDPLDGTTIGIGTPFTTTWVLQNTGSAEWSKSSYDISFLGALDNVWLHTGADLFDLSASVPAGGTYNFSVPMLAPTYTGTYGEAWQINNENGEIACQFYVYITVP